MRLEERQMISCKLCLCFIIRLKVFRESAPVKWNVLACETNLDPVSHFEKEILEINKCRYS
jgi:hypothetical protein